MLYKNTTHLLQPTFYVQNLLVFLAQKTKFIQIIFRIFARITTK